MNNFSSDDLLFDLEDTNKETLKLGTSDDIVIYTIKKFCADGNLGDIIDMLNAYPYFIETEKFTDILLTHHNMEEFENGTDKIIRYWIEKYSDDIFENDIVNEKIMNHVTNGFERMSDSINQANNIFLKNIESENNFFDDSVERSGIDFCDMINRNSAKEIAENITIFVGKIFSNISRREIFNYTMQQYPFFNLQIMIDVYSAIYEICTDTISRVVLMKERRKNSSSKGKYEEQPLLVHEGENESKQENTDHKRINMTSCLKWLVSLAENLVILKNYDIAYSVHNSLNSFFSCGKNKKTYEKIYQYVETLSCKFKKDEYSQLIKKSNSPQIPIMCRFLKGFQYIREQNFKESFESQHDNNEKITITMINYDKLRKVTKIIQEFKNCQEWRNNPSIENSHESLYEKVKKLLVSKIDIENKIKKNIKCDIRNHLKYNTNFKKNNKNRNKSHSDPLTVDKSIIKNSTNFEWKKCSPVNGILRDNIKILSADQLPTFSDTFIGSQNGDNNCNLQCKSEPEASKSSNISFTSSLHKIIPKRSIPSNETQISPTNIIGMYRKKKQISQPNINARNDDDVSLSPNIQNLPQRSFSVMTPPKNGVNYMPISDDKNNSSPLYENTTFFSPEKNNTYRKRVSNRMSMSLQRIPTFQNPPTTINQNCENKSKNVLMKSSSSVVNTFSSPDVSMTGSEQPIYLNGDKFCLFHEKTKTQFWIVENGCTIGTDETCEVNLLKINGNEINSEILNDANSFFARIDLIDGALILRRLTSKYEIWLNDVPISKNIGIKIKQGSTITLCHSVFKIKLTPM
jgi:hypothetical protein